MNDFSLPCAIVPHQQVQAVEVLGDIVVYGTSGDEGPSPYGLVRYRSGRPDPAFGSQGQVFVSVGTCEDDLCALKLRSDGTLVVLGTSYFYGEGSCWCLLKFLADGRLDPTFGLGGVTLLGPPQHYNVAHDFVDLGPHGFLAWGETCGPGNPWALVHLDPNGRVDPGISGAL